MFTLENGLIQKKEVRQDEQDIVVQIDSALSKEKLLEKLQQELRFPEYFGGNWDALADLMSDLSWLSKRVLLIHDSLPMLSEKDLEIYLEVLSSSVQKLKGTPHELVVIFNDSDEKYVTETLRKIQV